VVIGDRPVAGRGPAPMSLRLRPPRWEHPARGPLPRRWAVPGAGEGRPARRRPPPMSSSRLTP